MSVPRSIRRVRRQRAARGFLVGAFGVALLMAAAFLIGLSFGVDVGAGPRWTVLARPGTHSIHIPASQDPAPGGRAAFSLIAANAGTLAPSATTAAAPDDLESATLPLRGVGEHAAQGCFFWGGRHE